MIKAILTYPKDKEVLTQPSQEVDNIEEIQELIQDLKIQCTFLAEKEYQQFKLEFLNAYVFVLGEDKR